MLTRRRWHCWALALLAVVLSRGVRGQDDDRARVSIRADEVARAILTPIEEEGLSIRVDRSEDAQDLARRVPPGRALPILVIIVGAIAVVDLLMMIRELYRHTYYGGVLIDTRSQPPSVTSDPKVPASMVLVVHPDGTTTAFEGKRFDLDALRSALKAR